MPDLAAADGEDLRPLFEAMAASAVGVSRSLSAMSVERALAWPSPQPGLGLRRCDLRFTLKAARRHRKVLLWMTQADERDEVLLDAVLTASLTAVPLDVFAEPPRATPLRLLLPSLLWTEASAADRALYTNLIVDDGDPAPTFRNTLLLRLQDAVLALYVPAEGDFDNDDARLQFTGPGGTYDMRKDRKARRLRAGDYLLILHALADWAAGKVPVREVDTGTFLEATDGLADTPGDLDTAPERSDVADLVRRIIDAHRQLRATLAGAAKEPPLPDHSWAGVYSKLYLDGFTAKVALKLDGDGKIPTAKEDRYFDLNLSLAAVTSGSAETLLMEARIADVIKEPAETRRFVDALLADPKFVGEVADELEVESARAHALLAGARAYFYRDEREEKRKGRVDKDWCAFVMDVGERDVLAVYHCVFEISWDGRVDVGKRPKRHYLGRLTANDQLPEELVDYFARLSCTMLRWLNMFHENPRG